MGKFVKVPHDFNYPPLGLSPTNGAFTGQIINLSGEQVQFLGHVVLEDPEGGTKVISSSGGKIHWHSDASVVFADSGTTLRVGLQDVGTAASTPGSGDGTWDVYDDLVGGTDTITSDTPQGTSMSSGTKTVAHGDILAIVFELTARAGSDSVNVSALESVTNAGIRTNWPVVANSSFGSLVVQPLNPHAMIEFDDGTFGWLYGTWTFGSEPGTIAFDVNSTPDEYGNLFKLPFKAKCYGVEFQMMLLGDGADFEVSLYSDPFGTPTAVATVVVDASLTGGTFAEYANYFLFDTPVVLDAETEYAVTIRPTTSTDVRQYYQDVPDVGMWSLSGVPDPRCYAINRTGDTGAFSAFDSGTARDRRMSVSLKLGEMFVGTGQASFNLGI